MRNIKIQSAQSLFKIQLYGLPIKANPNLPCLVLHSEDKADSAYVITFYDQDSLQARSEIQLYGKSEISELRIIYHSEHRYLISSACEVFIVDAASGTLLGSYWCYDETVLPLADSTLFLSDIEAICIDMGGNEIWRQDFPDLMMDYKLRRDLNLMEVKCHDGQTVVIDVRTGEGYFRQPGI